MNNTLLKYSYLQESYVCEMLGNFSKSTGLLIEGMDKNAKQIISPTGVEKCDFCNLIKSKKEGRIKCEESYRVAISEAFKWKEPYFTRCHAGLVMWCVPIIIDGNNIGGIICGQVLLWEPDDYTYQEMKEINKEYDFEQLKECINKLEIISVDKSQAVANMMLSVVNYIINMSKESMEEKQNSAKWKKQIRIEMQRRKKENPNIYSNIDSYLRKERKLLQYIRIGEKDKSFELLPSLFTEISYLCNHDLNLIKMRSLELLSMISRAMIEGGIDSQLIMSKLEEYHIKLQQKDDLESVFVVIQNMTLELGEMIFLLSKNKHISILKKAREYINENYSQNILIEDVSEHVLLSASYLSNLFKKELKCTVNEYITKVRVEESIELMKKREYSIQVIAQKVGFSSSSHFTKIFKKQIGVTPIQYRNKFL